MKLAEKLFKESYESKVRLLKEAEELKQKEIKSKEPEIIAWIEKNLSDKFTEATKDGLSQIEIITGGDFNDFFEEYVYSYLIEQGFKISERGDVNSYKNIYFISWNLDQRF